MGNLISIIFLAVGLYLTLTAIFFIWKGKRACAWPHCEGVVIKAVLKEFSATSNDIGRSIWAPEIHYQYQVQGKGFKGTTSEVPGGIGDGAADTVNRVLERFKTGTRIVVYFDPANPANSVLVTGTNLGYFIFLALGILALVIGIFWPRLPSHLGI